MIKRSTINFWKMQGEGARGIQRVLNMIHGYVYYTLYDHYIACAIFVARTLSRFPKIIFKTMIIDFFGNRYHCKVITYENARKLIAVEEDIVLPTEESKKIIPWEIAKIAEINREMRLSYSMDLCMGCGMCISRCPTESISLVVNPEKGAIFDVDLMAALSRKSISNSRL